MPNHIGSLLFTLIHSVRSGLVLILKHHARSLGNPLWSLRTSVAEHLRSRRRTSPCRDSSHTPRDASSRPVVHAHSSSTDHQLHFWDCRFVPSRIPVPAHACARSLPGHKHLFRARHWPGCVCGPSSLGTDFLGPASHASLLLAMVMDRPCRALASCW